MNFILMQQHYAYLLNYMLTIWRMCEVASILQIISQNDFLCLISNFTNIYSKDPFEIGSVNYFVPNRFQGITKLNISHYLMAQQVKLAV